MKMQDRVAVDGSPMRMEDPVKMPQSNPMAPYQLSLKESEQVLERVRASHMVQAEFPLREAITKPNTTVHTNHFVVKIDPAKPFYEYNFTGLPRQMSKRTAQKLVQAFIDGTSFLATNRASFATDHARKIISWVKFPELSPKGVSSAEGRVPIAVGLQYAQGEIEPTKNIEARIKLINAALNMVVSTALVGGTFSSQANKYFINGGQTSLGSSLYAIRGYYYSIRPGMSQILLNLSSCTSAFYKPILVSEFLNDSVTFPNRPARLAQLRGLRVQLMYEPVHTGNEPRSRAATINARMKIIAGTGLPVTEQKFQLKGQNGNTGNEVTVKAYLEKTYNATLQNPGMPAINCGTDSRPTWYPPEKLFILPFQLFKRTVPDTLTAEMLDVACHFPKVTRALIEHEGLRKLGLVAGAGPTQLHTCPAVQIDSRMLQIPATVLPYPKPVYANGTVSMDTHNPKWNLYKRKLLHTNSKAVVKVFIVTVPQNDNKASVMHDENFLEQTWIGFKTAMQKTYETANFQFVGKAASPQFGHDLNAARAALGQAKEKGANFVMLLLEKKSVSAYSHFKDLADRRYGIHSVCVTWDKKRGFNPQYWANIALKLNLKLGGINHTVRGIETIMKDTLVLGADVTHPGQGSLLGTPSIAAIVGSVDQTAGKFLGSMRLQPRDSACEIIQKLEEMVLERIKAWSANHSGELPSNILYYRDGVSDSQYSQVKEQELPQIRSAFRILAEAAETSTVPQLKLTAFVVGKRHHVKLFPATSDAMRENGNCKPGTLIDTTITSPYYRDFYLQSHNSIKGTAKSAHYFPLVNDMGLTEQEMQSFTHKLCYTYVRATMGVSYAPPAYYADRLCERGRCYLRDFLSPPPDSPYTNESKKLKNKRTNDAKAAREAKFKAQRIRQIYNGQVNMAKSKEELQQEVMDDAMIEDIVKELVFEKAKQIFYGGSVERNPWDEKFSNSMFWM
ncbi:Piwi domain-containing protein [Phaeosphaeria sp. MPI-PUGE-AT-0046c]|nr:Piwi domain-containing protein [Phaeosphaeria sp. MPI-PUGE-AT-0046c]